jgi:hypothetical protein
MKKVTVYALKLTSGGMRRAASTQVLTQTQVIFMLEVELV